jgi:aspartyl-tRNA(Asn)/glutamyl-tRNA(Gln) amidotransferase subunit A
VTGAIFGMPPQPLWQRSATELATAYRQGTTTPEEVLEATLARIDAVNPRINAIITLDVAGARAAAQASARRWRAGEGLGPLDGVPSTVKDNIFVRGLRATWGSTLYRDFVPDVDETPVVRLRAAGAVILGKTNLSELALYGYTDNRLFGPSRNPWDLALTPGGSSGGAVAAVAAGMGPFALGTDGGGSIRRPAAHTGLVGFKPSRGMVPRGRGFPAILHDFEVVGPIARDVDDIILVMDTIGGARWRQSQQDRPAGSLRILYASTFSDAPVDPAIGDAVAAVAQKLAEQGHRVECVQRFDLAAAIGQVWPVINQTGVAWLLSQHGEAGIGTELAEMARAGRNLSAVDYLGALDAIKDVERKFDALFEHTDILLTPATAAMPWSATEPYPATIAGVPVGSRGHAVFTPFANALGLPAISLPCETWHQGLPIGFQLCSAHGRDHTLLALARAYHLQSGWRTRWPAL